MVAHTCCFINAATMRVPGRYPRRHHSSTCCNNSSTGTGVSPSAWSTTAFILAARVRNLLFRSCEDVRKGDHIYIREHPECAWGGVYARMKRRIGDQG
jgi:hypothetical protein